MKYILIIILTAAVYACNNSSAGSKVDYSTQGDAKILGVYITKDSGKQVDFLFRRITKIIKYDSASNKDIIIIDTIAGTPFINSFTPKDSTGRILKNKAGQDSLIYFQDYKAIGKDSVSWRVENIPLDTLLNKNRPINKPYK